MKRECETCHYGNYEYDPKSPCGRNCFSDPEHPLWSPMTNGDAVRMMTDEELRDLWSRVHFDDAFLPDCGDDCDYINFTCQGCPKTFYNWLKAPKCTAR